MNRRTDYYERKLRKMIIERRQVDDVEPWMEGQIHAAAMNWQMMEKVHETIMDGDLTSLETGSQGQVKTIVNPLLPMYKELQRTMLLHYEALGLNFKTAPKKMTETATKSGQEENDDPMAQAYGTATKILGGN